MNGNYHQIRAAASGGQLPPPPKPADIFLKRPNLRARLESDLFITTSLPLKCGLEQQKDHLLRRRKRLGTS